jgi:hypothetical protein
MDYKNIIFYNNYHNGDLHNSRGLITNLKNNLGNDKNYFYYHTKSLEIFKDIKNVISQNKAVPSSELILKMDDSLFINTHIGTVFEGYQFCYKGCNALGNKDMLNCLYKQLNLNLEETEEWNLVAEIDYTPFYTTNVDQFFKNNENKSILICNGMVLSGQSNNFLFDDIIFNLSNQYKNYNFIVTAPIKHKNPNIFNTQDIIQKVDCDLNEIAYLSQYCSCVVGRASGPFMFCQTKTTLDDPNKTFICINSYECDAYFSVLGKAKKVWSDNYEEKNIEKLISESILS